MASRRGNGEGSIYQIKNGRWRALITLGYDADGKRKRRYLYGKTKREIQEKLIRLQSDSLAGMLASPERLTLADYLGRWLEDSARPTIRASTHQRYGSLIRTHINPHLGGIPLSKLQPGHLQGLYTQLERQGLSPRSREFVHAVLHRALDRAVRWGYVPRNICDAVDKPRVPKKAMKVLSPEEVGRFLAAAEGDRLYAVYLLALTTGLRQGELLALQWEDVDFRAGAISVRHTLVKIKNEFRLEEPKTAKGRRRVDLPQIAAKALLAHKKLMLAEGTPGPLVFCSHTGTPIARENLLRRSFLQILKKAELPPIRFHDLRHTAATLMLLEGIHPKVVQERLGHAQIAITLDTYSHVLPSMQKDAADKLDRLFSDITRSS